MSSPPSKSSWRWAAQSKNAHRFGDYHSTIFDYFRIKINQFSGKYQFSKSSVDCWRRQTIKLICNSDISMTDVSDIFLFLDKQTKAYFWLRRGRFKTLNSIEIPNPICFFDWKFLTEFILINFTFPINSNIILIIKDPSN